MKTKVRLHASDPDHSDYLISTNGRRAERIWHHPEPLFESTIGQLLEIADIYANERCGFIDNEQSIYTIKNVHHNPRMNFLMDQDQMEEVLTEIYGIQQGNVLGIFHTHPNGYPWPSPRDIVGWPNPKLGWRYFLVAHGNVSEWELV